MNHGAVTDSGLDLQDSMEQGVWQAGNMENMNDEELGNTEC